MKFNCIICFSDFLEEDEETISFLETGASHICNPCYKQEVRKLFENSSKVLKNLRSKQSVD